MITVKEINSVEIGESKNVPRFLILSFLPRMFEKLVKDLFFFKKHMRRSRSQFVGKLYNAYTGVSNGECGEGARGEGGRGASRHTF